MRIIWTKYTTTCHICNRLVHEGSRAWWDFDSNITLHRGDCKIAYTRWYGNKKVKA